MPGITTNGTTFWIEAADGGPPVMVLCNLSTDIGEVTRTKDTEKCLEDINNRGDDPGTEIENADTTIEGFWIPGSATDVNWAELLLNGKTGMAGGSTLKDSLITRMALATASGAVVPLTAWVHKYKLLSASSDNKWKYRVTLVGTSAWMTDQFDWIADDGPVELAGFQTAIAAFYASIGVSSLQSLAALGVAASKATQVAMEAMSQQELASAGIDSGKSAGAKAGATAGAKKPKK